MRKNILTIAAICATLAACNSSKNQIPDGWVIKNEVKEIETIDLEEIAEAIEVKPIVSDEPIGEIRDLSGNSNDFIACDRRGETFYHIKDGKLVEKLHAKGNGPNEYHQLWTFSYLPTENIFYGYDNIGKIMCFQTSPFKFVSKSEIKYYPLSLTAAGGNKALFTAQPPLDECKDVETHELGGGAKMYNIKDSSAVYSFDGHSCTKLLSMVKSDDGWGASSFTRSGNDVLMALQMPKYTIYRYADGNVEKILTIDYGKMEKPEPRQEIKTEGDRTMVRMIIDGDYSSDCHFPQLNGSTFTYWYRTVLDEKSHYCLAIAAQNSIHVYSIKIGGLNMRVYPEMVDNGVYTKIIQGDWESKINEDEELSATGKRIIEAMKHNDENPVCLQFRLKDKYLKQ